MKSVSIPKDTMEELKRLANKKEKRIPSQKLINLACVYEMYCKRTAEGAHGKTQQFWMYYANSVRIYYILHRAAKTNDVELYAYALFQLTGLFF